jgi:hypothetical protein
VEGLFVIKAVFEGLVYDPKGEPIKVAYVGSEPCYVLNDDGFLRYIPAGDVDWQVWEALTSQITGHEDILSKQAAKMLGQEDIFTVAMLRSQLENKDEQFKAIQEKGLPEEARQYLGMMGFRITIDIHGKVIEVNQPQVYGDEGDE